MKEFTPNSAGFAEEEADLREAWSDAARAAAAAHRKARGAGKTKQQAKEEGRTAFEDNYGVSKTERKVARSYMGYKDAKSARAEAKASMKAWGSEVKPYSANRRQYKDAKGALSASKKWKKREEDEKKRFAKHMADAQEFFKKNPTATAYMNVFRTK